MSSCGEVEGLIIIGLRGLDQNLEEEIDWKRSFQNYMRRKRRGGGGGGGVQAIAYACSSDLADRRVRVRAGCSNTERGLLNGQSDNEVSNLLLRGQLHEMLVSRA